MTEPRYLIGGGEKLSEDIARPRRGAGEKAHPYSFREARAYLASQWRNVDTGLRALPSLACPGDEAVVAMTLHPTYLAKSYYPGNLLEELKLRHLGSRAVHVKPRKSANKKVSEETLAQPAPLLYLAGSVARISKFAKSIENWSPSDESIQRQFSQIEDVGLPDAGRAKFSVRKRSKQLLPMEVVLHAQELGDEHIIEGFKEFAKSIGFDVPIDRRRHAGGLCFLPMRASEDAIDALLDFSFLRAIRPMARIVPLDPIVRSIVPGFKVSLPDADVVAPELSAAIFDGGLPVGHGLERWVTEHDASGVGGAVASALKHGLAVTSAFLFGPLDPDEVAERPPVSVDHWRIVGDDTKDDDFELFSLLDRIEDVLSTRRYDFVNISLGPACAIEDDDVNAWTSTLDTLLSSGDTVATVACGNNGLGDAALKLNRIQPPSDGVNMIAVGAADRIGTPWARAKYSACGPGRSPGYVKPDLLSFGGSPNSPFLLLGPGKERQEPACAEPVLPHLLHFALVQPSVLSSRSPSGHRPLRHFWFITLMMQASIVLR